MNDSGIAVLTVRGSLMTDYTPLWKKSRDEKLKKTKGA